MPNRLGLPQAMARLNVIWVRGTFRPSDAKWGNWARRILELEGGNGKHVHRLLPYFALDILALPISNSNADNIYIFFFSLLNVGFLMTYIVI